MTVYEKLLTYSLGIISKKRYTKKEIEDKLLIRLKKIDNKSSSKDGSISEDVIIIVIERLIELNYINDNKFSQDYISQRALLRPRGIRLIKIELQKKGVPIDTIDKVFDTIEIDEGEMIDRVFNKKFGKFNKQDIDFYKFKSKVFTYLFSKGFGKDNIYNVFNSWYNNSV